MTAAEAPISPSLVSRLARKHTCQLVFNHIVRKSNPGSAFQTYSTLAERLTFRISEDAREFLDEASLMHHPAFSPQANVCFCSPPFELPTLTRKVKVGSGNLPLSNQPRFGPSRSSPPSPVALRWWRVLGEGHTQVSPRFDVASDGRLESFKRHRLDDDFRVNQRDSGGCVPALCTVCLPLCVSPYVFSCLAGPPAAASRLFAFPHRRDYLS